ncbi:MAG: hypothetical protein HZA95_03000 [Candidatus Vogelbacteria bacterium]|nr:hypothetical protein [Candidatus Vogelbacteria bacterium]
MRQFLLKVHFVIHSFKAQAGAISPGLIAAMQTFGDKLALKSALESMAPLAILGGKSVSDVVSNVLKGTKLDGLLTNGHSSERDDSDDSRRR